MNSKLVQHKSLKMKSDIGISSADYTVNNQVKLIHSGKIYFDSLSNLIKKAKESIHIQTYIFAADDTGNMIASALKDAAKRGVEIHLLVDGYASQDLPKDFIVQLKSAGINFRFFEPFFKSNHFYFGRRLHHKIIVVDTKYVLVGGLNIANHYNDLPNKPSWLDFALYVEGEIAQQLCVLCWKTWNSFPIKMDKIPCESATIDYAILKEKQIEVRMRRNDWIKRKNEISQTYVKMLQCSQREIVIFCSYFSPGKKIRWQMVKAIRRGVKIKVVVAGQSDIMIGKYVERWLYDWLLRKGVEIYEYQKNILHAKIAVCDDQLMTIGSYNINDLSALASIELNLDVKNTAFCKEVRKKLEQIIINDCVEINAEKYSRNNTIFKKLANWTAYQFIRMVFYLFTFNFKRLN